MNFQKYIGAGNDFIFTEAKDIPNSTNRPELAKKLCDPKWGIGADGLVLMEILNKESQQYKWDFYNSDGSTAEMCGNAARCAILYCYNNHEAEKCFIDTTIGIIAGQSIKNTYQVSWKLPSPQLTETKITLSNNKTVSGHFINTGVPHFVTTDQGINGRDCLLIQEHPIFAPDQTNVTLLNPAQDGKNKTRSFERGVRNFTLACGTGVIASAFVLQKMQPLAKYQLTAPGGQLEVIIKENTVTLIGPTELSFVGCIEI